MMIRRERPRCSDNPAPAVWRPRAPAAGDGGGRLLVTRLRPMPCETSFAACAAWWWAGGSRRPLRRGRRRRRSGFSTRWRQCTPLSAHWRWANSNLIVQGEEQEGTAFVLIRYFSVLMYIPIYLCRFFTTRTLQFISGCFAALLVSAKGIGCCCFIASFVPGHRGQANSSCVGDSVEHKVAVDEPYESLWIRLERYRRRRDSPSTEQSTKTLPDRGGSEFHRVNKSPGRPSPGLPLLYVVLLIKQAF